MDQNETLRRQLTNLLQRQQAHMLFEDAVADFPIEHINSRATNVPYTFWHLIEHIRLSQADILDYIRNPDYTAPDWPHDYWPDPDATSDAAGWQRTIDSFLSDRQALVDIVQDAGTDLTAQIPHGAPGHTILREILLTTDHTAYHVGEIGILRQVMGLWSAGHQGE